MIEDELRRAQAELLFGRTHAARLVALAREALIAGRDTPCLCELAALDPTASVVDAALLYARALDELGVSPIDEREALELLSWMPAGRIAAEIVDGTRTPLAGARALEELFCAFGHPRALGDFSYFVAMSDPLVAFDRKRLDEMIIAAARRLLQK